MAEASIISDYRFFLPPVVGAIIGWITNYVAIKLLFRPHLPVKIFGYKFPGLIPKRRKEIARSIARTIEREILSSEDVASMLKTVKWQEAGGKKIEEMLR